MSLVQSLLEYSSFIYSSLSETTKSSLQAVQNNAMRIIFKKKREYGNENLQRLSGVEPLESRMQQLTERYLEQAEINQNPLICDLIEEYEEFQTRNKKKHATLLCHSLYIKPPE